MSYQRIKSRNKWLIIAVIILSITLSLLAFGYVVNAFTLNSYATLLENNYQRSVYELATDLKNIEINLSKALVSTGLSSKEDLYQKIYTDCNQANEDLSRLPINHESVFQTTQFINEMGGFSYYLNDKLKNGNDLSKNDYDSVNELYQTCLYIQSVLNNFMSTYDGNYSILASSKDISNNSNSFNSVFSNMQAEGVEYPTLIYDGPFSQSQVNKEVKGLSNEEFTMEQAKQKLLDTYENIKDVTYEGETSGIFTTYNFSFKNDMNRSIYAQITKKGGFLLSVSSYAASDKDVLSLEECEQKAEEFASKLGLNLKAVWSTKITGMAYINLTPIIDDIIIYPDMIKVKVSANTGEVLGLEAQSYAFNHTERTIKAATINESTARSKVDSKLEIQSQKLTLIPIQYGSETLCYEYKCVYNKQTYYVYIDANLGTEVQILKVLNTTDGSLLI